MTLLERNNKLLSNIKEKLPELEKLLAEINSEWRYEDLVYRFYHHSFKVYNAQASTQKIFDLLKSLAPEENINQFFLSILKDGTNKKFEYEHNRDWEKHTRPILEAFFHAKYFLEMAVRYGKELSEAPELLPSGWAGLLYLYDLR